MLYEIPLNGAAILEMGGDVWSQNYCSGDNAQSKIAPTVPCCRNVPLSLPRHSQCDPGLHVALP